MRKNKHEQAQSHADSARRRRKTERGQSFTEFALLAPVAIILMAGLVDFGRIIMAQQVIINAAREGARQATLGIRTTSEVRTEVESYLTGAGLDLGRSSITINGANGNPGDPTEVSIGYTLELGALKLVVPQDHIPISSSSVMIHE